MTPPPFQRFLDEHRDAVWRLLVAAVGPDAADDCFQETFLSALTAYPRLRPGSDARAWVLTIAHNKALDHHRARTRRPVAGGDVPETLPAPPPAPGRTLDGDAWAAARALPPRMRAAVLLRVAGELSHAEAARAMGCSEAAARRAYADAVRRLRDTLPAEVVA